MSNYPILVCCKFQSELFRMFWINESSTGIYLRRDGEKEPSHFSYHTNGNTHFRRNRIRNSPNQEKILPSKQTPIAELHGYMFILNDSTPLNGAWFTNSTKIKTGEKANIIIDISKLPKFTHLHVNVMLLEKSSEAQFLIDYNPNIPSINTHKNVDCTVLPLKYFPDHKIGLGIFATEEKS